MEVVISREIDETRLRMLRSLWCQLLATPEEEQAPAPADISDVDWSEAA